MVHGNCHHIWKLDIGSKAAERKVILDHRALNFLNFSGIEPSHNLESLEPGHSLEVLEPGHSLEELEPGHSLEVRHSLEVLGLRHDLEVLEPTLELSFPELTGKPVLVGPTYTQHRLVEPAFDSHKQVERFFVLEVIALEKRCLATDHVQYFAIRPQYSTWQAIVHQSELVGIEHLLDFAGIRHWAETDCMQQLLIDTFVAYLYRRRASLPSSSDCKVSTQQRTSLNQDF